MKITLLGATGRTGLPLLRQAIEKGYKVKALVRSAEKLKNLTEKHGIDSGNIEIIEGDAYKMPESLKAAVEGSDAVVSVLGRNKNSPDDFLESAMEILVNTMEKEGGKRLVYLTGAGVPFPEDEPKGADKFFGFMLKIFAKKVLEDSKAAAEKVKNSGLNWTIVRAPMLTEGPKTDTYRVGYAGVGTGVKASRENVAAFMLKTVKEGSHIHDGPVVSNPE